MSTKKKAKTKQKHGTRHSNSNSSYFSGHILCFLPSERPTTAETSPHEHSHLRLRTTHQRRTNDTSTTHQRHKPYRRYFEVRILGACPVEKTKTKNHKRAARFCKRNNNSNNNDYDNNNIRPLHHSTNLVSQESLSGVDILLRGLCYCYFCHGWQRTRFRQKPARPPALPTHPPTHHSLLSFYFSPRPLSCPNR